MNFNRRFAVGFLLATAMIGWVAPGLVADACTVLRMKLNGRWIVARNHDWPTGDGLVLVHSRGVTKQALSVSHPIQWTSRYGSVSFAQFGVEIPFAGMNERGLTIDLLQLPETQFPAPDSGRPTVNATQWVQYQLDTAASVADVVASVDEIDPVPFLPMLERVHYFVTDASGDVAVVEYLNGRAVVRHGNSGDEKPASELRSLANSTWAASHRGLVSGQPANGSEDRFCRAAKMADLASTMDSSQDPIDVAAANLQALTQPRLTQWRLVYDIDERRITFWTTRATSHRWIDLDDLDFDGAPISGCLDIQADHSGDVRPHLTELDDAANQRIVDAAFDPILPDGVGAVMIKRMVLDYGRTRRFSTTPGTEARALQPAGR